MPLQIQTYIDSLQLSEHRKGYALALSAVGITIVLCRNVFAKRRLKKKRLNKQNAHAAEIKQYKLALTNVKLDEVSDILNLNAEEIVKAVRDGKYTSSQVLQAFQCKVLEAQERTNCVVGFVKEAEEEAEKLDENNKDQLLYGLPVSVKENYGLKGYDSTVGCAWRIGLLDEKDAIIVQVLRHQGAIPFVRTNLPQTMLSWNTSNPIFGTTNHPMDAMRTVGGSSGGEGAILACGASVLGWGSDIGGSIRIPCAMCGVYGLKTTANRISSKGTTAVMPGQNLVKSTYGPMARDMSTLILGMKAVLVPKMWELDPEVPPLPFDNQVLTDKRRLKIGFYLDDGYIESAPAMRRGVNLAVKHLRELGHTVVEWTMPKDYTKTVGSAYLTAICGDSGRTMREMLANDAVDSSMKSFMLLLYLPKPIKRVLSRIVKPFFDKLSLTLNASCGSKDVYEWWQLNSEAQNLRDTMLEAWRSNGFDAMICPGFPCPTALQETPSTCPGATSYTVIWNLLNFPVGSMPVTTVTQQDELDGNNYPTKDPWHSAIKKALKGSAGLPVNVQVIGKPWQEEQILRVMKELDDAVHKK